MKCPSWSSRVSLGQIIYLNLPELDHYSPNDDLEPLVRIVLIFNTNDFEDSIRDHITDLVDIFKDRS